MTLISALARALALITLIAGTAPAQLAIGGHQAPLPPARKRLTAPSGKLRSAPVADEHARLADFFNHMAPKERKQFAKAWKKMTPEQQNQVAAALKRKLSSNNKKTPSRRF